jgi:HD-like signal output (HDOD) protein
VVELAHQFLTKPCDAETLLSAINQTLKIRDCIENPRIRAALGNIGKIPALPRVYQELNEALRSDRCDGKSIAAIIAKDMSISAKLLQVVNSSFFGLGRRVSSTAEAVALLGVKQLRALVLSSYVFESFSASDSTLAISIESLWTSSMLTANLARRITLAQNLGDDRPDQAYMGGLLHNLGLLLFVTRMADKFGQVIQALAADPSVSFEDAEKQFLGTTHAEAGSYVLGLWNLPPRIVESVLLQHHPSELNYRGFCGVTAVHVAAALLAEKASPPGSLFTHALDLDYLSQIGLEGKIEHWRKLSEDMLDKAEASAGAMG